MNRAKLESVATAVFAGAVTVGLAIQGGVEVVQWTVLNGEDLEGGTLLVQAAWALGALLGGAVWYRRQRFARASTRLDHPPPTTFAGSGRVPVERIGDALAVLEDDTPLPPPVRAPTRTEPSQAVRVSGSRGRVRVSIEVEVSDDESPT